MKKEAIFAAGCFWGIQDTLDKLKGVTLTEAGYTGGHKEHPSYEDVCTENTGHAESVRVEFDDEQITYEKLLGAFWNMHDLTQMNRQGPDVGSQYRSAIFYKDDAQKQIAETSKQNITDSKKLDKEVVTEITQASAWWPAEDYHQKYFEKHPGKKIC